MAVSHKIWEDCVCVREVWGWDCDNSAEENHRLNHANLSLNP